MRLLLTAQGWALLAISITIGSPVLGIEPTTEPTSYPTVTVRATDENDIDVAKLSVHGRVVYVSSGMIALSSHMVDDDLRTLFRCSGADLHPIVIVELAGDAPVHRVSAVFDPEENIKVDIYLLNKLPKTFKSLAAMTPFASNIDQSEPGKIVFNFAPTTARYIALRWNRAKPGKKPFAIAEVSAFSNDSTHCFAPDLADAKDLLPDLTANVPVVPAISQ